MLALDAGTRPAAMAEESIDVFAPSLPTLRAFGILETEEVLDCGKVWLLVTPIFLHLGLVHLLFNAFSLLQLGPLAEEAFGPGRFLTLYVATGVVGNILSTAWGWGGAGASGAVFGLMGAVLVYVRRRRASIGPALVYRMLTRWLLYAALVTLFVPNVNHLAHAGGFLSGCGLGYLADRHGRWRAWRIVGRAVLPAVIACFVATALEAPRVSRRRDLEVFDGAARSGRQAVLDTLRGRVEAVEARVDLRDAIRTLDRPMHAGPEVEGFRRRLAEALREFEEAAAGAPGRDRAWEDFRATFQAYERWRDANECTYGPRR
ncbi:MAG TPA: rhomboid family intramembrane serine protease [Planctomycetota bacterium]|nr:rhomboid family intramembrane serine protease [Planctomycetota bacterium]